MKHLLLILTLILFACNKPDRSNPFDPHGTSYHPPVVAIMKSTQIPIRDTLIVYASIVDSARNIDSYLWMINDSDTVTTTIPALPMSWKNEGIVTIAVKAKDIAGVKSATSVCTVTVKLCAPYYEKFQPYTVDINDSIVLFAPARDSNGSVEERLWSYDGTTYFAGTDSQKVAFAVGGTQKIYLKCRDEDSVWSLVHTIPVTVTKQNPVVTAMKDQSINVNDSLVITANAVDNGAIIVWMWSVDGVNFVKGTSSLKTAFSSAKTTTVLVKCLDDDSLWSNVDTILVNVTEDAPVLSAVADTVVDQSEQITLSVSATDVNSNGSIVSYLWDTNGDGIWDDEGTAQSKSFSNPSGGWEKIIWGAKDDDGLIRKDTVMILFDRPPVFNSVPNANYAANNIVITWSCTDPDSGAAVLNYTLFTTTQVLGSTKLPTFSIDGAIFTVPCTVSIVATDLFGKSDTAQIRIVPNASDIEPENNSVDNALELRVGSSIEGSVSSSDPYDWYTFIPPYDMNVEVAVDNVGSSTDNVMGTVEIFNTNTFSPNISIHTNTDYDSIGNTTGGFYEKTVIMNAFRAGHQYWIKIRNYKMAMGPYKITLTETITNTYDDELENNSINNATLVEPFTTLVGSIGGVDKVDYYRFTAKKTDDFVVTVDNIGVSTDNVMGAVNIRDASTNAVLSSFVESTDNHGVGLTKGGFYDPASGTFGFVAGREYIIEILRYGKDMAPYKITFE